MANLGEIASAGKRVVEDVARPALTPIEEAPFVNAAAKMLVESGLVWNSVYAGPAIGKLTGARGPLTSFAEELSYGIRTQRWKNLVGDDVSGRVPAKIAWDIMRLHAQDKGLRAPKLLFVAAGHDRDMVPELSKWMASQKSLKDGNALFITEYIDKGRTINQVSAAFQENKIAFDVATVSAKDYLTAIGPTLALPRDSTLLFSNTSEATDMWLYAKPDGAYRRAIGVEKVSDSVISKPNVVDRAATLELRVRMLAISHELYNTVIKKA